MTSYWQKQKVPSLKSIKDEQLKSKMNSNGTTDSVSGLLVNDLNLENGFRRLFWLELV